MTHTVLTFIAKVKPDQVVPLSQLLQQIGDDPETNPYVPFRSLTLLHFASFVLHQSPQTPEYGPYLIFENNFDGELNDFLEDLCVHASAGLHQIYSCCLDYTIKNASDRSGIINYLSAHAVFPNAYHVGNTGRSAARIGQEKTLRDALEAHADTLVQAGHPSTPAALLASFQQFVRDDQKWSWIPGVGPRQTFMEQFVAWCKLILGAILLVIFLAPALIAMLVLRYKESADAVQANQADSEKVHTFLETENRTQSVQNHMASITVVKPGWLRRTALWSVLSAVNLVARAYQNYGTLSGIPSIHFAHWSMIDNGRRLLFLSNFDGSWENYLDDFIDKASIGLTGVWSNTVNFPRSYFLFWGGATDGPRFKAVARAYQNHGTLSGIPSIHFAHWSMIDNGRRLLFLSNFDGSWENYLDDFIDKASIGLTGVWSNTVNFPRTYFLFWGGATDGPRFKAVARDSQTVTNAWYSAYLDQTVQGIDNNSSIREDLLKPLDATAAAALLQRL